METDRSEGEEALNGSSSSSSNGGGMMRDKDVMDEGVEIEANPSFGGQMGDET